MPLWCLGQGSNLRRRDFQSLALPAELPRLMTRHCCIVPITEHDGCECLYGVGGGGCEPPLKSFLLHSRGNSPPYSKAHLPQTPCGTVLRVVAQSAQVLVAGCAFKHDSALPPAHSGHDRRRTGALQDAIGALPPRWRVPCIGILGSGIAVRVFLS